MTVSNNLLEKSIDEILRGAKELSEMLGEEKSKLNINQLKRLHSYVTRLWTRYKTYRIGDEESRKKKLNETIEELKFIKTFLIYQKGRGIDGYKVLEPEISNLIDQVKNEGTFEKFKKYMDAVVAYYTLKEKEKAKENNRKNDFNKTNK